MKNTYIAKYPMIWENDDFYLKIFCSIPNIATGIVLTTEHNTFIIDPGDGILRDLNKEFDKQTILGISDIFVSHGHHDHVGGVWSLLTYLSILKRTEPLNIHFPKGCVELEAICRAFHEVYEKELTYEINLIEIDTPSTFKINSTEILPFRVLHCEDSPEGKVEVVPSLGFKFTHEGKSICYGGDTAYCDSLVKNARGSDLAIIEAGALDDRESVLHMTMDQAIAIGETAGEYFLVHVPE